MCLVLSDRRANILIFILRVALLAIIVIIVYGCLKYYIRPGRKISNALEQKQTLIMDDKQSVHKNILVAYKGVLFEGEKYMGTKGEAFHITNIHLWARDNQKLVGLGIEDFSEIKRIIHSQYPHAELTWRSPVKELIQETDPNHTLKH
jgi:hypothetical protein